MPMKKVGCHVAISDLCWCNHRRDQHALFAYKCDNCTSCSKFSFMNETHPDAITDTIEEFLEGDMCVTVDKDRGSADKPVSVGIVSHQFQGNGEFCTGELGFAPTNPRHGEICNFPRTAAIHKTAESGLKDSGQRLQFASGMVRDVADDKPAFDLVIPEGIPYSELMLTRWAELLRKGAIKYSRRNWEKADSDEELDRAKASAFRHFMQWFSGETDEDHAAAVFFNINEVETIKWKQTNQKKEV